MGVKVVEQYDVSRAFPDHPGRPLQMLVWYPAERSRAKSMTVRDYADLRATELTFGRPQMPAEGQKALEGMQPALASRLRATRDAPVKRGHFPVVTYSPGLNGVSWENADLCEYLASHGYVVLASPNMGATTRKMTQDLPGIGAQARDISFLISYAATLPDADVSRVAAIGLSWGGISNLFAAARDERIDALVSLDGSMRYSPGFVRRSGDVHPGQMTIPLLSFAQRNLSLEDRERWLTPEERDGPNVLNAWTHGDLVNVHMPTLGHAMFGSMNQRNEDTWKLYFTERKMIQGDYGRKDALIAYGWMARYTLQFLDAYLKQDAPAMDFLKREPADNAVPAHVMVVEYRPAAVTN